MKGARWLPARWGAVWSAALAVLAISLVFVSEAAADLPAYGIASGKQCAGPINVGDPYVCLGSIDNTNSSSQGTVTTDQVVDTVVHPDGTVATTQTIAINASTLSPLGPVQLVDNGLAPAPSCDATRCTIPFGDHVVVGLNHYTAQLQDVGVAPQDTLSDIVAFRYRQVCDKPVAGSPCSTANAATGAGAATDVLPVPTTTTTDIHNGTHQVVTSVAAGTAVHDFVTVSAQAGQPAPTGKVEVQWFKNGNCTQPFTANNANETLVPGAGSVSTVDATDFVQTPATAGSYSFQAKYLGDGNSTSQFGTSTGPCEALNVVDAFIQITPQDATNPVGTTHTLTITVTATNGGVLAAGTANASIVSPPSTTGTFVSPPGSSCSYAGGAATASCTVVITSASGGLTQVHASSAVGFTNAFGSVTRSTGTPANVISGCQTNCDDATKHWGDAFIQITPQNATNAVGTNHTLTITVNATGGATIVAGTATATIVMPPSTTGSFVGSSSCSYPGGGTTASCTVVITSAVGGLTQVHAASNISVAGAAGSVLRETGTAANVTAGCSVNCSDATKHWVDAFIQITPQNATNPAGTNHTLTIIVNATGGGTLAAGAATASIVTPPSTTGSFVGSPSCAYTGGVATASCTVVISSAAAGLTQVHATSNVGFGNAAGTVTRATGTAANVTHGCTVNCDDATKHWVDANIQITPATATNPVGTTHVLTAHVNVNPGTGFTNAPDGTGISFTLTNTGGASATFVGPASCTTSGGSGSCTVVISSPTAGTTTIKASTTVVVGGISLTRTTGDGKPGDSADAVKTWTTTGGGQITNTCIQCRDFRGGTPQQFLIDTLEYRVYKGKIQSVTPGQFFYWAKVTTTTPNQVVTVSESNDSTNGAALLKLGNVFQIYDGDCKSGKTGTVNADQTGGSFTVATPGTYYIGVRYDTNTIIGTVAPTPATINYTFTTSLGSSASVELTPKT